MLNKLIDRHHELSGRLSKALEADDEVEIRSLDRQLAECHDALLAHEPGTSEEAREKFKFLLDRIFEANEASAYFSTAYEELLSLFDCYSE